MSMANEAHNNASHGRHRAVAIWCALVVAGMVGAAYAAVPLYRLFCQATGFDGTPRIATKPSDTVVDEMVTIRFDANVAPDLPWRFEPVQTTTKIKLGENTLAFFRATNTSDRPVWGMATFNVFPEQVAPFFDKLQCFCFTEQLLQPGESVEMPVSFFVDPRIMADKDAFWVRHITLSYTFYPATAPKSGVAGKADNPATPGAVQRKGQAG
jgi:cytochrome c oxidase assembly protein subunit 11